MKALKSSSVDPTVGKKRGSTLIKSTAENFGLADRLKDRLNKKVMQQMF